MGASLNFEGSASRILVSPGGDALDNPFSSGGTITAWVYPTAGGESNAELIFSKFASTTDGWAFFIADDTPDYRMWFRMGFSTTGLGFRSVDIKALPQDEWSHIAVTYDSSSTSNRPVFYLNGVVEAGETANIPVGTLTITSTIDVFIGDGSTLVNNYDGDMAWVTVYNSILTDSEIQEIMYKQQAVAGGILGSWALLDNPTGTIADWGTGNFPGTVQGSVTASSEGPPVHFPQMI